MWFRSRFRPAWASAWTLVALTAGLYIITARLGLALAMPPANKATAVWPPSGIALAALVLAGARVWPGVWLGAFLANVWDGLNPAAPTAFSVHAGISACIGTGSTAQALFGAWLLRRWTEHDTFLTRARSLFRFIGVAPLMCVMGATVGVSSLLVAGLTRWSDAGFSWWTWWLGDTVGVLVFAPLIIGWRQPFLWERTKWRFAEAGLLLVLLLGVGVFVFGGWSRWGSVTDALAYVLVPLLVWAAFRFGLHGAMASLVLVSGLAVWGTVHGYGPFVQNTRNGSLLLLQTFGGVLAVTGLALAGAVVEQREADCAKRALITELERALTEIKTIRGLIPICAWCKNIRNDQGSWEQLEKYLRQHTQAEFSHGICPVCLDKRLAQEATAG
jgi:integral membrane sensor domain MASE1